MTFSVCAKKIEEELIDFNGRRSLSDNEWQKSRVCNAV